MSTLVKYKTALLAKQVGFSWDTREYYHKNGNKEPFTTTGVEYDSERDCITDWNMNGGKSGLLTKVIPYPNKEEEILCSAPTQTDLQSWLREIHCIDVTVGVSVVYENDVRRIEYAYQITDHNDKKYNTSCYLNGVVEIVDNYEKSMELGLMVALVKINKRKRK